MNKDNKTENPKTGDSAEEALFVVFLATLSLVAVAVTKKKFVENK